MFIKDFLFPKFCLGCGFLGCYICPKCQAKLPYIEKDSCLYCQKPSLYGLTHPYCRRENGIDGMMTIFHYDIFLKKIIKSIKYRLAIEVWKELCLVIKPEKLAKISFYNNFYLQPIPLHPNRLRQRGFNQAKIIADFFSKLAGVAISDLLIRTKESPPQAQTKRGLSRFTNVQGVFKVTNKKLIKNKSFVLVDDVLTSGSTIKEAGKALKEDGVSRIYVLTLAKG